MDARSALRAQGREEGRAGGRGGGPPKRSGGAARTAAYPRRAPREEAREIGRAGRRVPGPSRGIVGADDQARGAESDFTLLATCANVAWMSLPVCSAVTCSRSAERVMAWALLSRILKAFWAPSTDSSTPFWYTLSGSRGASCSSLCRRNR